METPSTTLFILGNPKGGTPLMLPAPSIAIDLPLKYRSVKMLIRRPVAGESVFSIYPIARPST
jgi:hypothetical protein